MTHSSKIPYSPLQTQHQLRLLFSLATFTEAPCTCPILSHFKKNPQEMTMLHLLDANHTTGERPALMRTMAACPKPFSVGGLDNC